MKQKKDQIVENHPLEPFFTQSRIARLDSALRSRTRSVVVVLDNVRNDHNISAILRSADAFGIQDIYLVGESFSYSRGISLGTQQWLTFYNFEDGTSCSAALKTKSYQTVIFQSEEITQKQNRESIPVQKLPFDKKLALIFGNENRGVGDTFSDTADFISHIPMVGLVESFNVSVAAAITFYTAFLNDRPNLTDDERLALRHEWLKQDLRGGEQIWKRLEQERR